MQEESSLLNDLYDNFGERNLYKVFKISNTCSTAELKKAYKKLSLKHHPDKNVDKEDAKIKFQLLSKIHCLLSDPKKRKLYDDNGYVDDNFDNDSLESWEAYFRVLYPKVTISKITDFKNTYQGSDEERNDLKKFYVEFKGDMDKIFENLMLSSIDQEPRYREIIDDLISNNEVEAYENYINETQKKKTNRKKYHERQERQFAKTQKSKQDDDENDLAMLIMKSQQNRASSMNAFMDELEDKYAKKQPARKKSRMK